MVSDNWRVTIPLRRYTCSLCTHLYLNKRISYLLFISFNLTIQKTINKWKQIIIFFTTFYLSSWDWINFKFVMNIMFGKLIVSLRKSFESLLIYLLTTYLLLLLQCFDTFKKRFLLCDALLVADVIYLFFIIFLRILFIRMG